MKKEAEVWVKYAKDDLKSMEVMWDARRYGPTAFYCQQLLEKILKAVIIEFVSKRPPKIHDLLRLATEAKLKLSKDWQKTLKLLTRHYFLVRYPDMVKEYTASRKKMEPIVEKTKEIYKWILEKFNQF